LKKAAGAVKNAVKAAGKGVANAAKSIAHNVHDAVLTNEGVSQFLECLEACKDDKGQFDYACSLEVNVDGKTY